MKRKRLMTLMRLSVRAERERFGANATRAGSGKRDKKDCLEGESNSHLRITQAMLGHIDDRYETFVLAVILSRLDAQKSALAKYNIQIISCRRLHSRSHHISSMLLYFSEQTISTNCFVHPCVDCLDLRHVQCIVIDSGDLTTTRNKRLV